MNDLHPELQCRPISIIYDFEERLGVIVIADGECTDMTGCCAMFKRIDPNVRQIQTVAGEELDTVYTRTDTGWEAA